MTLKRLAVSAVLAALPLEPLSAAWLEAQTDHFIIDADTSEAKLRSFATRLERFDSALRRLYNAPEDAAGRSNRVLVFAVGHDALMRLCRGCAPETQGFYHTAGGTSAIVTSAFGIEASGEMSAQTILLHEYSHHFMYTSAPGAYPRWYSEGYAEFNSNVQFRADGGVVIGLPAQDRAWGLLKDLPAQETGHLISHRNTQLTVQVLFDPPRSLDRSAFDLERFYGRSWLLTHYLELSPTRQGQLAAYVSKYSHGTASPIAAQQAFGDVAQLETELDNYLAANRLFPPLLVPPAPVAPAIAISPVSAGAAAMMPAHMQFTIGVTPMEAKAALPGIVARAEAYPEDARVQVQLAEAAFDAEDFTTAQAASDRALKTDPGNPVAMLYKGRAELRIAMNTGADATKVAAARGWIVKANRADPDSAPTLIAYYRSFLEAKQPPNAAAINGLMRVAVVAPESPEARWWLANHFLGQNDPEMARQLLEPIAFSPHADAMNAPRRVIDLIDTKDFAGARKIMTEETARPAGE